MRSIVVLTLFAVVVMASSTDKRVFEIAEAPKLFKDFMKEYERTYKDEADKEVHYAAFVENLKKINRLNAKDSSAVYGINKFADYTEEESNMMRGFKKNKN